MRKKEYPYQNLSKNKQIQKFRKLDPVSYPCKNKSINNLPGERWKDIPGFKGLYMVSNMGRIKSLARTILYKNGKYIHKKERILSAGITPAPNYYVKDFTNQLNIVLYKENQHLSFSIRRLVYHCFVEPIDLENANFHVQCEDGNGFNLYYKNLKKVTPGEQQHRIYERERSVSSFSYLDMKKLARKGVPKRMRQVTQYDLKGKKLKVFKSIKAAAKATNSRTALIGQVLKGDQLKTGKYIWRYGDGPLQIDLTNYWEKGKQSSALKRRKIVSQYNLQGERIAIYPGIIEASRATDIQHSMISRCINGIISSAKGFIWKKGKGPKKISVRKIMYREKFFALNRKKVAQYTLSGEYLTTFESINKAAESAGTHPSSISAVAKGKYSHSGGFLWKYIS